MLSKSNFICIANRLLEKAVVEVAVDQNKAPGDLNEPSHTAAIVSKFPGLMNGLWGDVKFGGCFVHQSPYVNFTAKNKKRRCEVGDLLCLCKKTVDGKIRYNAALFQIKTDKTNLGVVKPDNINQRLLYTEWPVLSFDQGRADAGDNHYDIHPKAVTPGAQYMFINKFPYPCCEYNSCCAQYCESVVFTHDTASSVMENSSERSFGSFLWDFINWQNGRPISEPDANPKDEWSRLIWELVTRTRNNVYNINKNNSNCHMCNLRSNGEFFAFMTKIAVGNYDDSMYDKWLQKDNEAAYELIQSIKDKPNDGNRLPVEMNTSDGISILFIDFDEEIEVEHKKKQNYEEDKMSR